MKNNLNLLLLLFSTNFTIRCCQCENHRRKYEPTLDQILSNIDGEEKQEEFDEDWVRKVIASRPLPPHLKTRTSNWKNGIFAKRRLWPQIYIGRPTVLSPPKLYRSSNKRNLGKLEPLFQWTEYGKTLSEANTDSANRQSSEVADVEMQSKRRLLFEKRQHTHSQIKPRAFDVSVKIKKTSLLQTQDHSKFLEKVLSSMDNNHETHRNFSPESTTLPRKPHLVFEFRNHKNLSETLHNISDRYQNPEIAPMSPTTTPEPEPGVDFDHTLNEKPEDIELAKAQIEEKPSDLSAGAFANFSTDTHDPLFILTVIACSGAILFGVLVGVLLCLRSKLRDYPDSSLPKYEPLDASMVVTGNGYIENREQKAQNGRRELNCDPRIKAQIAFDNDLSDDDESYKDADADDPPMEHCSTNGTLHGDLEIENPGFKE